MQRTEAIRTQIQPSKPNYNQTNKSNRIFRARIIRGRVLNLGY